MLMVKLRSVRVGRVGQPSYIQGISTILRFDDYCWYVHLFVNLPCPAEGFSSEFALKLLAPLYGGLLFLAMQPSRPGCHVKWNEWNKWSIQYMTAWRHWDLLRYNEMVEVLGAQMLQEVGFGQRHCHRYLWQFFRRLLHFHHQSVLWM